MSAGPYRDCQKRMTDFSGVVPDLSMSNRHTPRWRLIPNLPSTESATVYMKRDT